MGRPQLRGEQAGSPALPRSTGRRLRLGAIYREGRAVEQDWDEAFHWYGLGASQGDAHAQNNLGTMCLRGAGCLVDEAKAVSWYRRAAEQGHLTAQANFAKRHLRGEGVAPRRRRCSRASLADNLGFGLEVPAPALERAMKVAAFDAVLAGMRDGLDSAVAERGANLSGGQRQRLALARGVLAASPSSLVLLDEPTSSLEAATEAQVFAALLAAFPDACVVASVHRLELLPSFDRVVLMERGRVVDTGPVDELRARQPLFRELWSRIAEAPRPRAYGA